MHWFQWHFACYRPQCMENIRKLCKFSRRLHSQCVVEMVTLLILSEAFSYAFTVYSLVIVFFFKKLTWFGGFKSTWTVLTPNLLGSWLPPCPPTFPLLLKSEISDYMQTDINFRYGCRLHIFQNRQWCSSPSQTIRFCHMRIVRQAKSRTSAWEAIDSVALKNFSFV